MELEENRKFLVLSQE